MMTIELPKSYAPDTSESEIRKKWDDAGAFHTTLDAPGEPYCIVIPPPNVTAPLHLGHAFNNTLQDILSRYHRMRGYNVLWMPGTDHAGIATQTVVEKRLLQQGTKRVDLGREAFVERVQAWKDEYEATIIEQLQAMGCSCDWDRVRFTMDPVCGKAVREAFFRLFKDRLIYRGKRLVNWDPVTLTALADDEVEMKDVQGHMWYLRYPLEDGSGHVTVATTRPETMLGDTAVAINPKDPRAESMRGKNVILPIVGRVIPLIEDPYVVRSRDMGGDPADAKSEFATGFLKVTPAHDPNDWEIGLRHDLDVINILAPDASISDTHGWEDVSDEAKQFVGMSREDARKAIVKWFKSHDLMDEIKDYAHSVGHSYRSHVPIEPYLSDQWYMKVSDDRLVGEAQRALSDEQFDGEKPLRIGGSPKSGTGILPVQKSITHDLQIHRRNLPHWQLGGSTYFITFRAATGVLSDQERQQVINAIMHWHGERWHVHLVTVMPDHVHLIATPLEIDRDNWHSLPKLLHSVKGFSAKEINTQRGSTGSLWQDEYFDRIIRDDDEFYEKWNYMVQNPVTAGLVSTGGEYPYTFRPDDDLGPHGQDARATGKEICTGKMPVPPVPGLAGDGELNFYPPRYARTFQSWHDNLRDWCISRQLWWGHRIPVWEVILRSSVHRFQSNPDTDPAVLQIKNDLEELIECGGITCEAFVLRAEVPGCYYVCTSDLAAHEILQGLGAYLDETNDPTSYDWPKGSDAPKKPSETRSLGELENKSQEAYERVSQYQVCKQDPDVLDTWFSSGLWPISTMGWPDPAAFPETEGLLNTFNPSTVLVTGRDIITLWVSRMVMFNRYLREGTLPFRHVYINPMIQDGHGQRMSKSLGNGVDPRDIIHSHGADALRFILCQIATSTQDVRLPVDMICPACEHEFDPKMITSPAGYRVAAPEQACPKCSKELFSAYGVATGLANPTDEKPLAMNSSSKFDLGRNFANKLWNAVRFALGNLTGGEVDTPPMNEWKDTLSLADRWIITRLHRTLHTVEDALANYQFSVYAETMYDFIWRDFCDWYLEAIKPTVRENPIQQQVLRTVLNAILRLLHPVCPFVTEALWPHVQAAGSAGMDGISLPPNDVLARADWPEIDATVKDDKAMELFERARKLSEVIRTIRGEKQISPKKKIDLHAPKPLITLINAADGIIQTAAGLGSVTEASERPENALTLSFEGEQLFLTGLSEAIDVAEEHLRQKKLVEELQKAVADYRNKLQNDNYVKRAPPNVVQETRERLVQSERDLDAAEKVLETLTT